MPYNDLRDFLDKLEEMEDLVRIKDEVDWNIEVGAIMRRCNETQSEAQLFENIKGYPEGYRIAGGILATFKRLAVAMDMDPESSYSDILDQYIERSKSPIKPMIVSDGPCKENILTDKDVDLFIFPTPILHGGDGGRYIGTLNVGVFKDLDSDWVNWGTYRLMIHDRDSTGVYITPSQHIGIIYEKCEARNKPLEYAAFISPDPIINFIAATGIPHGVNEVDVIGGLRKEPVQLIKCETADLYVPAASEIVLEGEILPHIRKDEGPFGEYAGYQVSGVVPRPVFKVKAITYRNNPILTASCIGVPVDDSHIISNMGWAAELKIALLQSGIPIKGVYLPPECALHLVVVSTETPHPYIANRIGNIIFGHKNGVYIQRVIVVNDDIDPEDMNMVMHAFATKCHPIKGTTVFERAYSCHITGFLSPQEKSFGFGTKVVYDCTWPLDWSKDDIPPRASFNNPELYSEEVQEKVLRNWGNYGFKQMK
jgi:4-hydroxy-3-polyprenylbenzoate decarboxylase